MNLNLEVIGDKFINANPLVQVVAVIVPLFTVFLLFGVIAFIMSKLDGGTYVASMEYAFRSGGVVLLVSGIITFLVTFLVMTTRD